MTDILTDNNVFRPELFLKYSLCNSTSVHETFYHNSWKGDSFEFPIILQGLQGQQF